MFIQTLQQEIAVECQEDARDLVDRQPDYWHVLSIYGRSTEESLPAFERARRLQQIRFDDVLHDDPERGLRAARPSEVNQAIQFSRSIGTAPLLIHCHAGISRSTAVAWLLIYDNLQGTLNAVSRSYSILE